jgi:S-formylglutathione hydrolase FrmB
MQRIAHNRSRLKMKLMKKHQKLLLLLIAFCFQYAANAATVDTINIYSKAMQKFSKCVVILPDSYHKAGNRFPVVYLLHGYGGSYSNWIKRVPQLKNYADEFQMMIVCPDGNYDSWYIDSPVDSSLRYETYVASEVPHFMDSAYQTISKRNFRAITGLSMGGHGALSLAWKHPDFFGAAGSMSGVQDLSPFKGKYDMVKIFGDTLNNNHFYNFSVINIVKKLLTQTPAIIFDCGVSDPFIETNRQLHAELLALKVPHDYIERAGTHNWDYWKNAVVYQLMFFYKYFTNN